MLVVELLVGGLGAFRFADSLSLLRGHYVMDALGFDQRTIYGHPPPFAQTNRAHVCAVPTRSRKRTEFRDRDDGA